MVYFDNLPLLHRIFTEAKRSLGYPHAHAHTYMCVGAKTMSAAFLSTSHHTPIQSHLEDRMTSGRIQKESKGARKISRSWRGLLSNTEDSCLMPRTQT